MKTTAERNDTAQLRVNEHTSGSAQFADRRPAAATQTHLQTLAAGSAHAAQLRALQASADTSPATAATQRLGTLQRMADDDEEPLQGKFKPLQRAVDEEEEPLQGKFATVQRAADEEEEPVQGQFDTAQREEDEDEPLQGKFHAAQMHSNAEQAAAPTQAAPRRNDTGLPDNLKTGIESLSGISMDNVRVHYNSAKPAQLNAHAYAQGTNIHLAPGQERHLPHEAWHVVQQAQGRVQPTAQMKESTPINNDPALEDEADVMGGKALQAMANRENTSPGQIGGGGRKNDMADEPPKPVVSPQATPAQLAPSHSATFAPSPASVPLIAALDAMIPAADAQAQADLAHPPTGTHTRHQAVYINRPTPMNWGYCVEEQLNPLAAAIGWNTQVILSNSHPDYGMTIAPNTELFVDLTSVAQAGVGGNHITTKLNASNRPLGQTWEGADITHNGPPGGPVPVLHTNGPVSPLHMRRFQAFKRYCNRPQSGYHPLKDNLRRRYRGLTHATFTQIWNRQQRGNFSRQAKAAGF